MFKQSVKQIMVLLPIYCWVQQYQSSFWLTVYSHCCHSIKKSHQWREQSLFV